MAWIQNSRTPTHQYRVHQVQLEEWALRVVLPFSKQRSENFQMEVDPNEKVDKLNGILEQFQLSAESIVALEHCRLLKREFQRDENKRCWCKKIREKTGEKKECRERELIWIRVVSLFPPFFPCLHLKKSQLWSKWNMPNRRCFERRNKTFDWWLGEGKEVECVISGQEWLLSETDPLDVKRCNQARIICSVEHFPSWKESNIGMNKGVKRFWKDQV